MMSSSQLPLQSGAEKALSDGWESHLLTGLRRLYSPPKQQVPSSNVNETQTVHCRPSVPQIGEHWFNGCIAYLPIGLGLPLENSTWWGTFKKSRKDTRLSDLVIWNQFSPCPLSASELPLWFGASLSQIGSLIPPQQRLHDTTVLGSLDQAWLLSTDCVPTREWTVPFGPCMVHRPQPLLFPCCKMTENGVARPKTVILGHSGSPDRGYAQSPESASLWYSNI